MTALAKRSSNRKLQIRPVVRDQQTSTYTQLSDNTKNLNIGPRWVPETKTRWPTKRRANYNFDFYFDLTIQFQIYFKACFRMMTLFHVGVNCRVN